MNEKTIKVLQKDTIDPRKNYENCFQKFVCRQVWIRGWFRFDKLRFLFLHKMYISNLK